MRVAHARIDARYDDAHAGVAGRPYVGGTDLLYAPLDRVGALGGLGDGVDHIELHRVIATDIGHVRPGGDPFTRSRLALRIRMLLLIQNTR
jgi:hypothetical protein